VTDAVTETEAEADAVTETESEAEAETETETADGNIVWSTEKRALMGLV